MGFLWIFGDFWLVHDLQGGAMELSLCDPDREFGICILS